MRTNLRSLKRRAAKAFPPPGCGCPAAVVREPGMPPVPNPCPRCGKARLVIVLEDESEFCLPTRGAIA
ncbi:MAG: hypothetical protein KF787_00410 [Phycisphaeraceae bacterium]|nr:hypothetical protein [Phycisphaerae bacterium]MBX3391084.1 hypothetical protein [Phycisphaeraceae bacterium]